SSDVCSSDLQTFFIYKTVNGAGYGEDTMDSGALIWCQPRMFDVRDPQIDDVAGLCNDCLRFVDNPLGDEIVFRQFTQCYNDTLYVRVSSSLVPIGQVLFSMFFRDDGELPQQSVISHCPADSCFLVLIVVQTQPEMETRALGHSHPQARVLFDRGKQFGV